MGRLTALILGPVSWGGAKRSNIFKFQLHSQFQRFLNQTLYVFSQIEDIKHIKIGFSFGRLCHASRVGLGGTGGQKFNISKHGHVVYQIEGDEE